MSPNRIHWHTTIPKSEQPINRIELHQLHFWVNNNHKFHSAIKQFCAIILNNYEQFARHQNFVHQNGNHSLNLSVFLKVFFYFCKVFYFFEKVQEFNEVFQYFLRYENLFGTSWIKFKFWIIDLEFFFGLFVNWAAKFIDGQQNYLFGQQKIYFFGKPFS